ncbi:hypothetical protein [Nitrolancea hollandica]|uniref:Uncharacterized protein n=1 Tax=Nitrolancea hollandica Lb TaxID=1129897 RepID=I4ELL7_9BACT|nr:hypothetical protein [Nitrolancea hollandica]CCF85579.1 hypothetical protein NITHO_5160023 [Nitrolancea hollandica Lb]
MAYSERAIERRRCTGTTKAGDPCQAWAVWDDPRQLCVQHAGRGQRGPRSGVRKSERTHYQPCTCIAYAWPHRPASGLCCWPDPPRYRSLIPPSTHSWPRVTPEMRQLQRMLSQRWGYWGNPRSRRWKIYG